MINLLLLAEIVLPIILIIILGFFAWRLIRKKWIHRIFAGLVYKKNPFVSEFYEQVGHSVEEKGNKICICGRCQAENSIHSKYCSECGHKLVLIPKESRARV